MEGKDEEGMGDLQPCRLPGQPACRGAHNGLRRAGCLGISFVHKGQFRHEAAERGNLSFLFPNLLKGESDDMYWVNLPGLLMALITSTTGSFPSLYKS